jgi:hypothetical protein
MLSRRGPIVIRSRRRRLLALALSLSGVAGCSGGFGDSSRTAEPFAKADYLVTPIPSDAVIDPRSAQIVDQLTTDPNPAAALLVEYGIPIVEADVDTPVVSITCTAQRDEICGVESVAPIRIPEDAAPNTGTDGALVVVDTDAGRTYELWRAERVSASEWSVEWGSTNELDGDGITTSGGSGSGLSRLVGIVRIDELRNGAIDHAIAVSSSETCTSEWRDPAWSSDGRRDGPHCVPMGARLQLDPTIDLDGLELRPGERIVAEALQEYGAYVVDSGASLISVFFELEPPTPGNELGEVLTDLGFRWDYDPLDGIPWERLEMLQNWDGSDDT